MMSDGVRSSLFIGRFQPFHDGHQTVVRALLAEGKQVCIALRDTSIDARNPFTIAERIAQISAAFPGLDIITIPDIEEVVYGRDVGYGIREIQVSPEIAAISATKIRAVQ